MNLEKIQSFYFIGIGGVGMSALARYFKSKGKEVWGYDKTKTDLTTELESEEIKIHYNENVELVRKEIALKNISNENLLIVITPAVPADHKEMCYLQEQNYVLKKRSEVLGMVTKN